MHYGRRDEPGSGKGKTIRIAAFQVKYMGMSEPITFGGTIEKNRIVGKFGEPLDNKVELMRRMSFWQNPGDLCYRKQPK